MTVDSVYYIEVYANDDEVTYIFDYESIGSTAVQAYSVLSSDTTQRTLLVENTDYTLFLERAEFPTYNGGRIVLNQPIASDSFLQVERKTPIATDYLAVAGEPFESLQYEFAMDRICFIQQEIEGSACDCRGAPPVVACKQYECDAYDDVVLSFDPLNYTMVADLPGESPAIDITGNNRNSGTVTIEAETGYPIDTCSVTNAVKVNDQANFDYRVTASAPASTSDPAFFAAMDDLTTTGFVAWMSGLPTGLAPMLGVLSSVGFGQAMDVEWDNNADDTSRLRLRWNNGSGQQQLYTEALPGMNRAFGEIFPFGINIKRLGESGGLWPFTYEVYIDNALATSGSSPDGPQTFVGNAEAGTASVRWGAGSFQVGTIMNVSRSFNMSGPLSAQQLLELADGYAQNQITYQDPNPLCTPCLVYECDAYNTYLLANSTTYYPMTDGFDGVSVGSVPATYDGVTMFDAVGAKDLLGVAIPAANFNPEAGGAESGCGTSYYQQGAVGNSWWINTAVDWPTGNKRSGTIGITKKYETSASFTAVVLRLGATQGRHSIDIENTVIEIDFAAGEAYSIPLAGMSVDAQGFQVITLNWYADGDNTTFDLYDANVLFSTDTFIGNFGDQGPSDRNELQVFVSSGTGNGNGIFLQDLWVDQTGDFDAAAAKAAYDQSLPTYQDPRPECQ